MGDSYRYELSRRTRRSGWATPRTMGVTRTEETPEKQAATKEGRRKAQARQLKIW